MSPAWYEYQIESISPIAEDFTLDVTHAVTPAISGGVTDTKAIKPAIDKGLTTPSHLKHLKHAKKHTLPFLSLPPHQRQCYCCNGTDFWVKGPPGHPSWICRRCHPPLDDPDYDVSIPVQSVPVNFVCRSCGRTNYRQGFVSRICIRCQVPEQQHTLGRMKRATPPEQADIFELPSFDDMTSTPRPNMAATTTQQNLIQGDLQQ